MLNFFDNIKKNPGYIRQIVFDDVLFAEYKCPLAVRKNPMWSPHHYLIYVCKGRKIWHTPYGSWDLREGDCVLVKHGACIVEQFFDTEFCVLVFFVSDHFIRKTFSEYPLTNQIDGSADHSKPVLSVKVNQRLLSFMHSMAPYFTKISESDKYIIFLKFKELILNLATSSENKQISAFLYEVSRRTKPSIEEIMENNFCFNLSLEEFAELTCRSVSTFKRDFKDVYKTTLSKWLRDRRLNYSKMLMSDTGKTITDIQLESGFENLSHFSKVFKDQFGVSPQQYRETVSYSY